MPSAFDWLRSHKRTLRERKGIKVPPKAKTILWLIFGLLIYFAIRYIGNIVYPFLWAIITTYLFAPLIYFLETRTKLPRILWIIIVYIILGFFIYWGLSVLIPIINTQLIELMGTPAQFKSEFLKKIIAELNNIKLFGANIDLNNSILQFQNWLRTQVEVLAVPVIFGTIEYLLLTLLYLVFTFYLLLDGEKYVRFFLMLIPPKYRKEVTEVSKDINTTAGAYIRGLIMLIIIMGSMAWLTLTLLRVKYALVLSVATGILEIIPVIGPIIATIIVTLVALGQPVVAYGLSNLHLASIIIIVYFVLRQIEDYLIIPNVVGKFIHVHPIVVIFSLLIGAKAAGMVGVFLALPIAAVLKILFYYFYPKLT